MQDLAQRILDARPVTGFTSIRQIVDWDNKLEFKTIISGFGPDKFSDLVLSSIMLTPGSDHRVIRGSFKQINLNAGTTPTMTEDIDVVTYGRFVGSQTDEIFPIHLSETNENGEFVFEHITNDFTEFALVGFFQDSGEVFHRSGLIPIQSFPLGELNYNPILLNQSEGQTDAQFRENVETQVGTVVDGDKTITELTSDFKNDFIEMKGNIHAPNTFLFFDSDITFTSHMTILGSQFASNWIRDLTSLIAVNSVVDQNHSNAGFIIASILSFLIPGVGLFLGPIVTLLLLAIDHSLDTSDSIRNQITSSLREKLGDETLQTFAEIIRQQVEDATPTQQLGLLFLTDFEETPTDPLEAIIQFMIDHKTVQKVDINSENIVFNVWLTLPFFISE
jgi:hypothetical protein